ncbi:MAG TPA: ATP-dependent helicase, partial [Acidimicrobiales bacterium]|nr:ATP-dependent helicase [Acidimicrobiales bacterium]
QHHRLGLSPAVHVADEEVRLALLCDELGCTPAKARRFADRLADRKRAVSSGSPGDEELDAVLRRYDAVLRDRGMVDFDDLLVLPVTLLEADPELAAAYRDRWSEICVDEYQDVDELQYRLLRLITRPGGNLCAIGDPDQAIYGFRGGDVGYFLRFRHDFPTARVVELTRSYRSTPTIVRAALGAIAPATLVPGRALSVERVVADDRPITVHRAAGPREEGEAVADAIERMLGGASFWTLDRRAADGSTKPGLSFADFAVLYRTDAQSGPIADALDRRGFPIQVRSHERLADRPAVRAVVAALDARRPVPSPPTGNPPAVTVAEQLDRAIDVTGRPGDASRVAALAVQALLRPLADSYGTDLDRFLDDVELWTEVDTWDPRADRISLLTLHAAKGLEFPVVFVVGCEDGLLPFRLTPAPGASDGDGASDAAEERRLFFVGMTRAIDRLALTSAATRHRWGAMREQPVSPFVGDIDPALVDAMTGPGHDQARRSTASRQLRLL